MGTNNKRTMKNLIVLILITLCLGCSSKQKNELTEEEIRNELQELYTYGYSIQELSLRTYYTEEQIVNCIQGIQKLPDTYNDRVEKLYLLNKEESIIPISKLQKTSSECLWDIYTKAQNSLLLSQYTNIGISQVINALTLRHPLSNTDSLRALIAYVNMQYNIDTIPNRIVVSPYFYQYTQENGIMNIKVPQSYHTIYNNQEKNKLAYYLWQAEQFELEANKQLRISLQQKMKLHAINVSENFVDKDIDSYINDIKNLFKRKEDIEKSYREKLKTELNLSQLEFDLKNEILYYCVSINSSRILLINDLLNYNNITNNLSIPENMVLQDFVVKTENLNRLITNRRINMVKDATIDISGLAITTLSSFSTGSTGTIIGFLTWEGLSKIANDIDGIFRSDQDINIDKQMDTLKIKIRDQIEISLLKQTNNGNDISKELDENTHQFYNEIRNEFNIK